MTFFFRKKFSENYRLRVSSAISYVSRERGQDGVTAELGLSGGAGVDCKLHLNSKKKAVGLFKGSGQVSISLPFLGPELEPFEVRSFRKIFPFSGPLKVRLSIFSGRESLN